MARRGVSGAASVRRLAGDFRRPRQRMLHFPAWRSGDIIDLEVVVCSLIAIFRFALMV